MSIHEYNDDEPSSVLFSGAEALAAGGADRIVAAIQAAARADAARRLQDEVDSAAWQDSITASAYDQARARGEVNRLLHYGHWIPVRNGLTAAFVAENYPRWTWKDLVQVLQDAGVFVPGLPPRCDGGVGAVHFNHDGSWLVEWEDGHTTRSTT